MKDFRLLKYLKPYWIWALLTPLFMILEVQIDLLQPKLMSTIVDEGVLGGNIQLIIATGLKMLGFAVLGGLGGLLSAGCGSVASQKFGCDLRKSVFSAVMHLSFEQTDKFTTGSLVTRMTNDVNASIDFVTTALRMFVRTVMLFGGGIIMALSLNVRFGLVFFVSLPIQILVLWLLLSKASPLFSVVQKLLDKVNSVVQENVTGARVVKAYVREGYEANRFDKANNDLMGANLQVMKIMAILNPVLMILMNLSVLAIIYIGGWQVEAQAMQVGDVMAAITYVQQILMSVMMVGMMFHQVTRAKASMSRLNEVLETTPAVLGGTEAVAAGGGAISFSHVRFAYPADKDVRPVLEDITLDILPGETFAVLGATGSGKSTLVNLIPRFYDPVEGMVSVNGTDLKDYDLHALREKIGVVLQKSELFSGTVAENIRWGNPDASMEEVVAAAKIAQADEFVTSFQRGYDTMISEKGASLSGGQKQRLSIARAILKNPEILIFDDSTSALDLGTEARLQKALKEHLEHTTVIMIAQRVASVMNADRIAVLEDGKIADCGTHAELMERCSVYQDIYYSQMKKGDALHA